MITAWKARIGAALKLCEATGEQGDAHVIAVMLDTIKLIVFGAGKVAGKRLLVGG